MPTTKSEASQEPQEPQEPLNLPSPPKITQFTLFPHLPCELRLVIWTYALHSPRIHFLSCDGSNPPTSHLSQQRHHSLLSTNHESRYVALTMLSAAFGTSVNFGSDVLFATSKKDTYTGWKFSSTNAHTGLMRVAQGYGMRRLAVPLQLWKWRRDISSQAGKSMCGVRGVDELILWGEVAEGVRLDGVSVQGEEVEFEGQGADFTTIREVDASIIDCDVDVDVKQVLAKAKELDPEWTVPEVKFWAVTLRDPMGIVGAANLYDGRWVTTGGLYPVTQSQFEARHPRLI